MWPTRNILGSQNPHNTRAQTTNSFPTSHSDDLCSSCSLGPFKTLEQLQNQNRKTQTHTVQFQHKVKVILFPYFWKITNLWIGKLVLRCTTHGLKTSQQLSGSRSYYHHRRRHFKLRKPRHREVKQHARGHSARKQQNCAFRESGTLLYVLPSPFNPESMNPPEQPVLEPNWANGIVKHVCICAEKQRNKETQQKQAN